MDTAAVPARSLRPPVAPGWGDRLYFPFALYVAVGAAWMLSGAGGPRITFYVGLISKLPAELGCILAVADTARRVARGPLRTAWWYLASALTLYLIADFIGFIQWLMGIDPFRGPPTSSTARSICRSRPRRCG